MANITMPQLGETITEGTIIRWFKQVGDHVDVDEILFEVSTDKVDSEVPSPLTGELSEILAQEGELVDVGQILARIDDTTRTATDAPMAADLPTPAPTSDNAPSTTEWSQRYSPVVRRLIDEHGIDPTTIKGSGTAGRITRADIDRAVLETAKATPSELPQSPAPPPTPAASTRPITASSPAAAVSVPALSNRDRVVPLNRVRALTAEHMVTSKQTAPHVLTAIEVDYERVEQVRHEARARWKADEGFNLTYLPFIVRAVVDALHNFPHLNSSFAIDHLVVHDEVNLAVAVDIDFDGLLAPVVRNANGKRLRQIAREIADIASRARTKQLQPDELSGGTFTITNAGQYGTLMQFPIINQPQVAILSTDGVQRKPVVVADEHGNESIAIHSVGVLALAWDHRAFDGAYAAAFLHRIKEALETRDWLAEVG